MNYKLMFVDEIDDGNKIICIIKCQNKSIVRGYFDFKAEEFYICEFYEKNLPEKETPLRALQDIKEMLNVEHDWPLKRIARIVRLIEEGKLKRKRNKKNEKRNN